MPPVLQTITTSDVEQAREVLSEMYVDNELRIGSAPGTFALSLQLSTAGAVHVGRMRFGPSFDVVADPVAELLVVMPLTGRMLLRHAEEVQLDASTPAMVPRGTDFELELSEDFSELAVPLPASAVAEQAAAVLGDAAADVRFTGVQPVDRARARAWTAAVLHVERELRAPGSLLSSPLVQAETVGMLAAQALVTFPNTALTLDTPPGAGWVGSAVVRRAMAHLEQHADRPITVGDVARAAGVGPRALQQAFRRHRGTTPLAELRRIRLDRAHERLRRADPAAGVTVRGVAAAWGFGDLHRFTVAYRERYGQHPQTTLDAHQG